MATNFFQQQDSARRKTFQLVVYFVLAILILIALVYALLLALSMYGAREPVSWWQPELLLLAAPGVGLVVGGASGFKTGNVRNRSCGHDPPRGSLCPGRLSRLDLGSFYNWGRGAWLTQFFAGA